MNQWNFRWALSLACVLSAGPALAGDVQGTVRDAATLTPIPGAAVTLHVVIPDSVAFTVISDAGGAYAIGEVPPGNEVYVLTCYHEGHANFYARLPDPASGISYDILLDSLPPPPSPGDPPDSSEVSGQVVTTDGPGMKPVANATVTLISGGWVFSAATDADGRYVLYVNPGVYAATIDATGYESVHDAGLSAEPSGLTYNAVLTASLLGVSGNGARGSIALSGAFPNPFSDVATIQFRLARAGHVVLRIHDLAGREARTLVSDWRPAGLHTVTLPAGDLAAGTYFCVLESGGLRAAQRISLVR